MNSYPSEWRIVSVGDIANGLKSGLSRKLSSSDIGLPVLRSNNLMNGGGIDYTDIKYWYVDDPQGARTENYVLVDGDLLINFINSISAIGKASIYHNVLGRDVIYTTNIMCLRVRRKSILPHYFLYLTQTEDYNQYIQAITKPAVNQASFTTVDFKRWEFPLPPLPEQRKIAQILGTWDEAIAATEKLIAALQRRKQGLMQRLLTGQVRFGEFGGSEWREVKFSDVLDIEIGGTPSRANPEYWDTEKQTQNRWLSIRDIAGKFVSDSSEYLSDLGVKRSSARLFTPGTVIMSFKLTIGRTAILKKSSYTNEAICALVPKREDTVLPEYLFHALSVVNFEQEIDQAVKGKTLNKQKLRRLGLKLPPIAEQRKLAEILDKVDVEIDSTRNYKSLIESQKQGLMQRLLTGQVRVLGSRPPSGKGPGDQGNSGIGVAPSRKGVNETSPRFREKGTAHWLFEGQVRVTG